MNEWSSSETRAAPRAEPERAARDLDHSGDEHIDALTMDLDGLPAFATLEKRQEPVVS